MLLTIISFLFVFTAITVVHEFGHLFFSKRAGIRVHEFGIGFGPTIFSIKKNHTTYKINALPILGYVKIAGIDTEDPEEKNTPESEKYYNKPLAQRFLSIFSGPLMNILLGFSVFSLIFMIAGIPVGISNEISAVSLGSEAANIGLRAGDKIIAIDGVVYENPEDAVQLIHKSAGKELNLTIERGRERLNTAATPELNERLKIGLIGFTLKAKYKRVDPFTAIYHGLMQTVNLTLLILSLFGRLLIGRLSFGDIAGPVGIAHITGQYAQRGFLSLLSFLAFFSVNVAVLNLLPLPALDGGRLFFVLLEAIRRKPISIEKENKVHYAGLFIFLGLLAILTIKDVIRIFTH